MWIKVTTSTRHATLITGFLDVIVLKYITLMKRQFLVTHTIRQTYDSRITSQLGYKYTFVEILCPQKIAYPYIS